MRMVCSGNTMMRYPTIKMSRKPSTGWFEEQKEKRPCYRVSCLSHESAKAPASPRFAYAQDANSPVAIVL